MGRRRLDMGSGCKCSFRFDERYEGDDEDLLDALTDLEEAVAYIAPEDIDGTSPLPRAILEAQYHQNVGQYWKRGSLHPALRLLGRFRKQ